MGGGIAAAIALILFGAAAIRIPFTTLGVLLYSRR
jgi:EamA domain-containing membrane protein RarD